MGAGRFERGPAGGSPRLVPKPDGYADYAEQASAAEPSRDQGRHRYSLGRNVFGSRAFGSGTLGSGAFRNGPGYAGRRRGERTLRQRSIRFTITILLIIPLLSLIALWAYAATSTVGGAIAKRNADTVQR